MQDRFQEEPQEALKEEHGEETFGEEAREKEMLDTGVPSLADNVRILSPGQMVLKRFFRSKLSMVGLVTMIVLFLFSFVGPLFDFLPFVWGEQEADYSGGKVSILSQEVVYEVDGEQYICYYVSETQHTLNNEGPISPEHILGTDQNGYDIFSRLMYGGRVSLTVGLVVIFLETILGVLLGGLAGYFGKWVDQIVMRIVDIFNCIPQWPILLIISSMLSANEVEDVAKLYIMMAMLTLLGWAGTARLVRGQILSLREQEFMTAADAIGLRTSRKIFRHLVPNVIPQLIVTMTLGLGGIILTEATLGFLGMGLPSSCATWGNMINAATTTEYLEHYPNMWVPAGVCIVLAVLAFNFIGDGLRDAFDPKSKR